MNDQINQQEMEDTVVRVGARHPSMVYAQHPPLRGSAAWESWIHLTPEEQALFEKEGIQKRIKAELSKPRADHSGDPYFKNLLA